MPSGNFAQSTIEVTTGDRRARKREARRSHLLDLAADLVERVGVPGVTMAALAEAADYAPASLYTYFPSRSALLASLQQRALLTLAAEAEHHLARWDRAIERTADLPVADLARLWAFSDLFLAAPRLYPREFRLQQQLLVTTGEQETSDAATVVPAAAVVLDVPRRLLDAATESGALEPHPPVLDPLGSPVDGSVLRTLAWITSLNGALMVDNLTTGLPATGFTLGTELTNSLLRGWGADPTPLAAARDLSSGWID